MGEYELINAVRVYARAHYEDGDGWDYLVEAWADGDILEVIEDATTVATAIYRVAQALDAIAQREREIRAEAF